MPDTHSQPVVVSRSFRILGRLCILTGVPAALAEWIAYSWEYEEYADCAHTPFVVTIGGHRRDTSYDSPAIEAEYASGSSRIELVGSAEMLSHPDCMTALYLAIAEALRGSDLIPLHASVAMRDGVATAFLGPSGAGKSSTLVEAMIQGWSPIAEDVAWYDPSTGIIYGWDRGIRLWPAGYDRLRVRLEPRFGGDRFSWESGADGKLYLPYTALEPGPRRGVLRRIVFVDRQPAATAPSAWRPLAPRDAVRVLWEAIGIPMEPRNRQRLAQVMTRLLDSLEFSTLSVGTTVPDLAALERQIGGF